MLKAGTALADITPSLGGSLAGSMRDRTSTHVHDPLQVRCLVLDDGQQKLVLAICDLVAIRGEEVNKARHLIHSHTGIGMSNILVAATHSHSAATPGQVFQSEADPAYLDFLVTRIADAARCAVNNLAPARLGYGVASEPNEVFNRRFHMKPGTMPDGPFPTTTDKVKMNPGSENPNIVEPAGPIDPEIPMIAVQHADGQPMALLANYALHYVGGGGGTDISADYFAMWADGIARRINACCPPVSPDRPAFLGIMTNGCSGDINNIDVRQKLVQPYPYHQMRKVAENVADAAHKVWPTIQYEADVKLGVRERTLTLGVRKPSAADVAHAKRVLAGTGSALTKLHEIYANETLHLAERPDTKTTVVQAMRIGDVGVVTLPGEAFVEIGLELKKKSPFNVTLCIELANDYAGYIPTARHHELGGYETWRARSSYLVPDAAARIIEAGVEMLKELANA